MYLENFFSVLQYCSCIHCICYISIYLTCLQALLGVYAKDVHVRLACLNAVKCIPAVASRSLPENVDVASSIWIALHDPEKVCVTKYLGMMFAL